MRLIARFVDVLRLAAPTGAERLAQGALPLDGGAGIAWTEMARGLLVHWVQLEPSPTGLRVADCRVLAPTEWNFHPRGLLARTLAGLRGADAAAQAARAAVAFDPCVEFSVDAASTTLREPAHA
jgi:Ni,Fe-hydrogenase I large subunit